MEQANIKSMQKELLERKAQDHTTNKNKEAAVLKAVCGGNKRVSYCGTAPLMLSFCSVCLCLESMLDMFLRMPIGDDKNKSCDSP
jgi:hypothetical protein